MKNNYLFDKKLKDYNDYVSIMQKTLMDGFSFISDETIAQGINDLNNITDLKKQLLLIKTSIITDRKLDKNPKSFKISTLLMLAYMIANHEKQINGMTDEQLVVLSLFGTYLDQDRKQKFMDVFADKELLDTIINKSSDVGDQISIYVAVNHKFLDFDNGPCQNIEQKRQEAIQYINSNTKSSIVDYAAELVKEDLIKIGM